MRINFSIFLIALLLLVTMKSFARQGFDPWMTGPLLAPSGHTIPKGHINYEPYLFVTNLYGFYNNSWEVDRLPSTNITTPTGYLSIGLTNCMDLSISVPYNFTRVEDKYSSGFGDPVVSFGFQILRDTPNTYIPDLRLSVGETFPAGKYRDLDPDQLGADANGIGSYQTTVSTDFQKMFTLKSGKATSTRLSLGYTVPARTKVTGLNVFGGGIGTNGTVKPGNRFTADLGLEYSLTQHWVPAIDAVFIDAQSSNFSGDPGVDASGLPAPVGARSLDVFSLAPALEYNFTEKVGLIGGVWFSVTGRNTPNFASAVIALDVYQ